MLFYVVCGFLLLFSAGYYFSIKILNLLVAHFSALYSLKIIAITPYDVLLTILQIDLLLVAVITLPILISWLIIYISPALYENEKRYLSYIPGAIFLAALGLVSGWFLTTKIFIPYLQTFASIVNVQNTWSVIQLISFITTVCLIFVGAFQMPIIFTILVNMKIIKLDNATNLRKIALILALVLAAVATPQTDPISQITVAVPFYFLFEITLQYSLWKKKKGD
jgi:sec-independent protein translocase protein TatC